MRARLRAARPTGDLLVAEYVEVHELLDRTNSRRCTVVFSPLTETPNGLEWRRLHETWVDRGLSSELR